MRIISQNRTLSFDFDHTPIWRQDEVIYASISGKERVIGKYVTSERAAAVFEDIHYEYVDLSKTVYATYDIPEE